MFKPNRIYLVGRHSDGSLTASGTCDSASPRFLHVVLYEAPGRPHADLALDANLWEEVTMVDQWVSQSVDQQSSRSLDQLISRSVNQ